MCRLPTASGWSVGTENHLLAIQSSETGAKPILYSPQINESLSAHTGAIRRSSKTTRSLGPLLSPLRAFLPLGPPFPAWLLARGRPVCSLLPVAQSTFPFLRFFPAEHLKRSALPSSTESHEACFPQRTGSTRPGRKCGQGVSARTSVPGAGAPQGHLEGFLGLAWDWGSAQKPEVAAGSQCGRSVQGRGDLRVNTWRPKNTEQWWNFGPF